MKRKEQLSCGTTAGNDLRFGASLTPFDGAETLGATAAKVALRTLKYNLEEAVGTELSDGQFMALFRCIQTLAPSRPLGAGSFAGGYERPMEQLLSEQGIDCRTDDVFSFFNIRRKAGSAPRRYRNLMLVVPHASTILPDKNLFRLDPDSEERKLIDYYADELFVPQQPVEGIESMVFPYCRLYCDVECTVGDQLDGRGLGISYSRWEGRKWRKFSTIGDAFRLYTDFHSDTSMKILGKRGPLLLVNCHSFSSQPNLLTRNPAGTDVCIGFNDDASRPGRIVTGNIVAHFKSRGYSVSVNTPTAGSATFAVPSEYHSVSIAVNKRLYMNEQTLEKTAGFNRVKSDLQSVYRALLKERK